MQRIRCSEIWGGNRTTDVDLQTGTLNASLFSSSCEGGRGGDVYYLSVCRFDMLTRVAVADVAGHGEAVGMVGKWLYNALASRMNSYDTKGVLTELNDLANARGLEALSTAAVFTLHRLRRFGYIAYAGHPPILIKKRDSGEWKPLDVPQVKGPVNLPLGVIDGTRYEQRKERIHSGDQIVVYTDGVTEARDAYGALFGVERLRAVLNESRSGAPPEIKRDVIAALHDFTGGHLGHDDVTLMVFEAA